MENKTKIPIRQLTTMAMLSAFSFLLVLLQHSLPPIAPFAAAPFLKIDIKDVVIVISGFLYGPLSTVLISVVVSLLEMITVSTTFFYGFFMNIVSTCAFVCPAALTYRKKKSIKGAILGLILGIICVSVTMVLWNYIITPAYMGYPREAVASLLLPVFLPFNLLKSTINSALTMLLYKPIANILRKTGRVAESGGTLAKGKISLGVMLASSFLLISLILIILAMMGVL